MLVQIVMFKCQTDPALRQIPIDICNSSRTQIDYRVVQNANTALENENRASITVNIPELEEIGVRRPGY